MYKSISSNGSLSLSANVMQLLLDYLRFSASSFTAIGKTSVMSDDASVVTVHKFVSEQLNLTKEVILNAKVYLRKSSVTICTVS